MKSPETRVSLLNRLTMPDSGEAWDEFIQTYRPLVYRVACAKGLQDADAEDLTQEVMSKVAKAMATFEHRGCGSFRGWLFQVTRNLVVNQLTRRRQTQGSGDTRVLLNLQQQPERHTDSGTLFTLEYRRIRFRQIASELQASFAADTWKAFWLTAVEKHSIESVASLLGKSPGSVRVARCRVLARLRERALAEEDSQFMLPKSNH